MSSHATLEGNDLACIRGERVVFMGLSFRIEPGAALLVTGPNGAGKSSLLRVMAGLLPAVAGDLLWNGVPIHAGEEPHGARLGFVGHHDAVKTALSVAENVSFWAGLRGGGAIGPALARFGLSDLADFPAKLLSAGQKRRLALARLLAAPAPLWLLDEPTLGLDRVSVAALEQAIADHRAGGGMVAVSTHAEIALPGAVALDLGAFQANTE